MAWLLIIVVSVFETGVGVLLKQSHGMTSLPTAAARTRPVTATTKLPSGRWVHVSFPPTAALSLPPGRSERPGPLLPGDGPVECLRDGVIRRG